MQCKQAHDYAHIKCNQSKFMSLLPLLVLLLSKKFWSFSIPQCCSLFVHVQLLLPHDAFTYIFVPTSPPFSSISIKGVLLIDTKDCIGVDGWHLNLAFFDGQHHICWNDTSCRIFDLDTNWWVTFPYVIVWVIHLIILNSCGWGNLFHLMIT